MPESFPTTSAFDRFLRHATDVLNADPEVAGFAVGGSYASGEMDDYSDLDLILVTRERIAGNKERMIDYAKRLGHFLSGFTGEHVGEPRVLICLYEQPLLHVDIKFLTLDEFESRVEDPVLLIDREGVLQLIMNQHPASYPKPDYQWIEDRYWTWIHYCLLKIGRGEYMEAFDFFAYLRMVVLGPLVQVRNARLPRGVRRVEIDLSAEDQQALLKTIPEYNRAALLTSLRAAVELYRNLRSQLFGPELSLQTATEHSVMDYLEKIQQQHP